MPNFPTSADFSPRNFRQSRDSLFRPPELQTSADLGPGPPVKQDPGLPWPGLPGLVPRRPRETSLPPHFDREANPARRRRAPAGQVRLWWVVPAFGAPRTPRIPLAGSRVACPERDRGVPSAQAVRRSGRVAGDRWQVTAGVRGSRPPPPPPIVPGLPSLPARRPHREARNPRATHPPFFCRSERPRNRGHAPPRPRSANWPGSEARRGFPPSVQPSPSLRRRGFCWGLGGCWEKRTGGSDEAEAGAYEGVGGRCLPTAPPLLPLCARRDRVRPTPNPLRSALPPRPPL